MNMEQAKEIVQSLSSLYPLKDYEEEAVLTVLQNVEEKPKCDECAGCTTWKCDCANIRDKAIDDFMELALKKFTEFDVKHGYPTVADCKVILRDIAEQLKHE